MMPFLELLEDLASLVPAASTSQFFSNSTIPGEFNYLSNTTNILSIISMVLLEPLSSEHTESSKLQYFQFNFNLLSFLYIF